MLWIYSALRKECFVCCCGCVSFLCLCNSIWHRVWFWRRERRSKFGSKKFREQKSMRSAAMEVQKWWRNRCVWASRKVVICAYKQRVKCVCVCVHAEPWQISVCCCLVCACVHILMSHCDPCCLISSVSLLSFHLCGCAVSCRLPPLLCPSLLCLPLFLSRSGCSIELCWRGWETKTYTHTHSARFVSVYAHVLSSQPVLPTKIDGRESSCHATNSLILKHNY